MQRAPTDYPDGKEDDVLVVEFTVLDIPCIGLNGGQESACGWCKDKWGVSWQITPAVLTASLSDPDAALRRRVFTAMMDMKKIDVAAINAARQG